MTNPYETPESELALDHHEAPEYVGFWLRFVAFFIDNLLVGVVLVIFGFSYVGMNAFNSEQQQPGLWLLVQFVLPIVFFILFWVYRNATPGKMMLSTEIVDANTGKAPSKGQYVVRYIGYYISSIVLGLGFIWIAFDSKKQGWHDKMAGTVVVRAKEKVTAQ